LVRSSIVVTVNSFQFCEEPFQLDGGVFSSFLVVTLGYHTIAVFGIIDLQTVFHKYV